MRLILGISLSRRAIGMAILSYGSLIKWNIQSFQKVQGDSKDRLILHAIKQLINKYPLDAISVKIPDNIERYKKLIKLIGVINTLCEQKKIKCHFYTLKDLKGHYSEDIRINKRALMQFVLDKYSILMPSYRMEIAGSKEYYVKIFEAVAAAHVCSKALDDMSK